MARNHLAALFAAAGAAALITVSLPAYAEGQDSAARRASEESAQQQRSVQDARQPASQAIGSTPGAAMGSSVQSSAGSRTAGPRDPYEDTFLTPYEVRTPGARDNIDD